MTAEPAGSDILGRIAASVVDLLPRKTAQLTEEALAQGIPPRTILLQGLAAGMKRVGELFACKEFYVPEVLLASRAMEAGFTLLRPRMTEPAQPRLGRIALGVVRGDIHDIGKNIVKTLLSAEGFELIDLGKDVPVAEFVRVVAERKPDLLGLSSLMTTTMPLMEDIIRELERQGLRRSVKVIAGGAPLTSDYAQKIGADGYAPDAPSAVREVKRLLGIEA